MGRIVSVFFIVLVILGCNIKREKKCMVEDIKLTYIINNYSSCEVSFSDSIQLSLYWENKLHVWRMIEMYEDIVGLIKTKLITNNYFIVIYFLPDGSIIVGGPSCMNCSIRGNSHTKYKIIDDTIKEDIKVNYREPSYSFTLKNPLTGAIIPFEKALVLESSIINKDLSAFVYRQ